MKKILAVLLTLSLLLCCSISQAGGIDYMALVNKQNPLPEGWENALETVTVTNSLGDEVEVEKKAYEAYSQLKAYLEEKEGIYIELDSARRSVAAQQDILERFTEKYGADYAAKTVATPGYSEHHTGLALDLYFKLKNDDGSFTDVYYNEDMEKEEYLDIWEKIHEKLPDYGFILRYLPDKEHITGYRYEPWHIRYIDDSGKALIMKASGLTLEEIVSGKMAPEVALEGVESYIFTDEDLTDAMITIKCRIASLKGVVLKEIRYCGDSVDNGDNIDWLNSYFESPRYLDAIEFVTTFYTTDECDPSLEPNTTYEAYPWWLGHLGSGEWEIVDVDL